MSATGVARSHERFAYLQLAINVVLFGLSWPIIKVGLQAASPLWFAAARAAHHDNTFAINGFVVSGLHDGCMNAFQRDTIQLCWAAFSTKITDR